MYIPPTYGEHPPQAHLLRAQEVSSQLDAAYTGAIMWWVLPTQEHHTQKSKPLSALAPFVFLPLPSRYRLGELVLLAVVQRLSYQGRDYVLSIYYSQILIATQTAGRLRAART